MTRTRASTRRAVTSRQAEMRARPVNEFQSSLYIDPTKIPKGWTYRWVRETTHGQPDQNNLTLALRNGWVPVPADKHPEFLPPVIKGLTDHMDREIIRNGGLILCMRLTRDVERDRAFAQMMSDQAVNSRDYEADQDDGVPRFDESSPAMVEQVTARGADFK